MNFIKQITGKKSIVALISLALFFSGMEAFANAPIPEDQDVIKLLGRPSKLALSNKKLRFLVWNLHKGADKPFPTEFIYLGFQSDLILAQEIFLDKKMNTVFQFLPQFMSTTATSFFSGKELTRTGVATFSTVKAESLSFLRTEVKEPITETPKVSLVTTYPIRDSKKKLTVVTIHAINFVSTPSFMLEMKRLYLKLKDLPKPLVFAGDFNTWNKDRINILEELALKLGLQEVPFSPDNRTTFNKFPLDHFFHSSDLKVASAKVESWSEGSDHKPLTVVLEFQNLDESLDSYYEHN